MGKMFSMANVGQRNDKDFYQSPFGILYEFYDRYNHYLTGKRILEPFAGQGAIIKALKQKDPNLDITGFDIETGTDFFDTTEEYDVIVTNPPYKNTLKVVEHSLKIANEVFLLMPLSHLSGQARYNSGIYKIYLDSVDILTRMPMFTRELREDGKFTTGMMVVAWYHFRRSNDLFVDQEAYPCINFMDVSKWVVGKGDQK